MPWDRKRLLSYVETTQLISGVTDKLIFMRTEKVWGMFHILDKALVHFSYIVPK